MESQILKGLNQAQRDAVVNYDSPSLIIAGAGSGKTRVLTSRIAYMIEQGVAPYNILALTFTNKAAEQMRERIAQMLPDGRHRYIRMGTFHSVFSRILRDNAERIGFPQSFTIYEPSDCKNLLKTIVKELNLDDTKYKPAMLASRISYAKNCLVTPGAYLANAGAAAEDRRMQIPEFGNIYNIYCARCKRNGAMDFDDLLLQTNILLRDCPDVTARYQEQFKYILVDEYQDTNYAQYVIIRRLSQLHSKVCVVGYDARVGKATLASIIDTDEGAAHLGEVALISKNTPIRESGVLFYDTLYDENASCHLALGVGFPECIEGGYDMSKEELLEHGVNVSSTHVDFMIGTDDIDITGITPDGREVVIFQNGQWSWE